MILLNLQLFAGEKTEKATPKKRQDARNKGQVARSQEFGQAFVLLAGLFALKLLSGTYYDELARMFQNKLSMGLAYEITEESVRLLFLELAWLVTKLVLPLMGVVLVIGVFISYMQVGVLFTLKPVTPDINKINPIQGIKNIFSMRTVIELIKSILKMVVVGVIVYLELTGDWERVSQMGDMAVRDSLKIMGSLAFDILWKATIALFCIALFDFWFQRFDYEKNLRMSKQEVKEEYKQMEGSPEVKGKIKERQRSMAMRRMMADVPQADVVITNPTHFAIAIKYDPNAMQAPKIVAKGIDEVAQRIKKVAREADVTLVENRPLARTLYASVEIGDSIPQELFQAVAEVLAYVYRIKGKV